MSRIHDLEGAIRESYGLIREYQDIIRLSDDPRTIRRAERAIAGQWELIDGYLHEYEPLCAHMGHAIPDDVAQIAFEAGRAGQVAGDETPRQAPKYEIHIERADHVAIGDGAQSTHQQVHANEESRVSGVAQAVGGNATLDHEERGSASEEVAPPVRPPRRKRPIPSRAHDPSSEYAYDAFVSYSDADREWVEIELLPRLERAGIRYIDPFQFELGRPRLAEIERAVQESRRTLLILTPNYVQDAWQQFDSILAGSRDLDAGKWRVIPIIIRPCELPARLQALVSVDLGADEECEWQRMISALSLPQRAKEQVDGKEILAIETVLIPAGEFWMGSAEGDASALENERPQHRRLLPPYRIGKYPVTNAQYHAFVQEAQYAAPEHWTGGTVPPGKETHPVANVSYEDAVAFCRWLSQVTKRYYRLPVEEEWEKAARGLDKRQYPWGNEWHPGRCNTRESGIRTTTPVTTYQEKGGSPFGVVDLSGNVAEWTCSWYERYPNARCHGLHFGRTHRVVRGGSWIHSAQCARVSFRGRYKPETRRLFLGFRVASEEL